MNIQEIAELAGVSRATVSRYLNNGYLSEEKRERIQKVIEETGYIPSTQAQMLRTKKTRLIGVILPRISSETISKVVHGISQPLNESGYHMLLANTDNDVKKEVEYLRIFNNRAVDGVILIATLFGKEEREMLAKMKVPIVIVGQQYPNHCCVYHNDVDAARDLARLLLKKGKKNLGFLGVTKADKAVGTDRRQGFLEACQEAGVKEEEIVSAECTFSMESGYEKMQELLEKNPNLDGVFCATATLAMGAMEYAREQGKRIPEDIGFVGIGDNQMTRVVDPKLTTAHYYYTTSGVEAGNMMLSLLDGHVTAAREVKLGYEVLERGSV